MKKQTEPTVREPSRCPIGNQLRSLKPWAAFEFFPIFRAPTRLRGRFIDGHVVKDARLAVPDGGTKAYARITPGIDAPSYAISFGEGPVRSPRTCRTSLHRVR